MLFPHFQQGMLTFLNFFYCLYKCEHHQLKVTIGQLPDDFLRLDAGTSNGTSAAPLTDEQLARQLQHEINASVRLIACFDAFTKN
jgi:hypothetical protein